MSQVQAKPEDLAACASVADPKRRTYAAAVRSLDANIGRILATLKETGMEENTWVIFTSDNGGMPNDGGRNKPLRGAKGTLFEGGIRVPGLMRWPARIRPGISSSQVASVLDVFPTVCAQLGVSVSGLPLDGMDLSPVVFEGKSIERSLFFKTSNGQHAFQHAGWKLVTLDGKSMLFNLSVDPFEEKDLSAEFPGRVAQLQTAWEDVEASFPAGTK